MADPVSKIRPVEDVRTAPRPYGSETEQPSTVLTGYWTVERVRRALDLNDAGSFEMIHAFRSTLTRHPRIGGQGGARGQRVATPLGIKRELHPPEGYASSALSPAGRLVAQVESLFADDGPMGHGMRAYLEGELADFGLGFATMRFDPSTSGASWTPVIEPWPLCAVEAKGRRYEAIFADGTRETIVGGDGRWIVIEATCYETWREGAVRTLGESFMSNAQAGRDANRLSEAAGQNPVVGTVPVECIAESKDEKAFRATIDGISRGKQAVIKRTGYELERLSSDAAEHVKIFEILWERGDNYAAHAYLGQDGTAETGSTGTYGARKVLDGVRRDLVERDCKALCSAYAHVILPYLWYNYGRVDLAPRACYLVPDEAEEARAKAARDEKRSARAAFMNEAKAFGPGLTPEIVLAIADEHGIMCTRQMAEALAGIEASRSALTSPP